METLLILIVAILAVIAVVQVVRVIELSNDVRGGSKETEVTDKDNNTQGTLLFISLFVMFIGFSWMAIEYNEKLLPDSASEHGVKIDNLWDISMILIIVAFILTHIVLLYFAYKFRGNRNRKAVYMEHNNRLEFIWTIVPAIVLAGLIIYGLSTWSEIMTPSADEDEPLIVEIYGQQFNWRARYAGEDNTLGYANVRMIEGVNQLGLDPQDPNSLDDIVTTELHLPVNRPVLLKFRSQDVIHSAYLPHFRVQMNVLPGTETRFRFVPKVTTAQMREDPEVRAKVAGINDIRLAAGETEWEFDYVIACNKICGSAHYNMQMKVVVETEEEYNKWLSEQKSFAEL